MISCPHYIAKNNIFSCQKNNIYDNYKINNAIAIIGLNDKIKNKEIINCAYITALRCYLILYNYAII